MCDERISHARGFYPQSLARASIACDVCPRPKMWCWGRIFLLLFGVLYSRLRNRKCANVYTYVHHVKGSLRVRTKSNTIYHWLLFFFFFCSFVLNLSHQCVRLCCSVCVFLRPCVWRLRAKFGISARVNGSESRASFWPENRFGELGETLWICVHCFENMRHSFKKCV